jgi:hypothetical protein
MVALSGHVQINVGKERKVYECLDISRRQQGKKGGGLL